MSAQIWCLMGDHHDVADTTFDGRLAPGALVLLARLIRLDGLDDLIGEVPEDVSHVWSGCRVRGHGCRMVREQSDKFGTDLTFDAAVLCCRCQISLPPKTTAECAGSPCRT